MKINHELMGLRPKPRQDYSAAPDGAQSKVCNLLIFEGPMNHSEVKESWWILLQPILSV